MEDYCEICGEDSNQKYVHTLPCGHSYHYECIQKTFLYDRTRRNKCPACRKSSNLLPIVNGLPKLLLNIHYYGTTPPNYTNTKCEEILKSGKRKGNTCNAKCMIGFNICKRHHKSMINKKLKEKNNKDKSNKDKTTNKKLQTISDLNTNQQTIVA